MGLLPICLRFVTNLTQFVTNLAQFVTNLSQIFTNLNWICFMCKLIHKGLGRSSFTSVNVFWCDFLVNVLTF